MYGIGLFGGQYDTCTHACYHGPTEEHVSDASRSMHSDPRKGYLWLHCGLDHRIVNPVQDVNRFLHNWLIRFLLLMGGYIVTYNSKFHARR